MISRATYVFRCLELPGSGVLRTKRLTSRMSNLAKSYGPTGWVEGMHSTPANHISVTRCQKMNQGILARGQVPFRHYGGIDDVTRDIE